MAEPGHAASNPADTGTPIAHPLTTPGSSQSAATDAGRAIDSREAGAGTLLADAAPQRLDAAPAPAHDRTDASKPAIDAKDAAPEVIQHDAGDAGAQTPAPGSVFTACAASDRCQPGLLCTLDLGLGFGTADMGYCTATCAAGACPQPASGMIQATCSGGLCLLGSCERASCPSGMSCQMSVTGVGTVFQCAP